MAWREEYTQIVRNMIAADVWGLPGKKVFVDPVLGSDGGDGSIVNPLKTFTTGKSLLRNNRNDALFLIGGASALTETLPITWNLSYTHLIGLAAPVMYGIRNRLVNSTDGTGSQTQTPFFTLSGNGCRVENLMVSQEGSHATLNAVALYISGARNYLKNVTARVLGALAVVDASKRDVVFASPDGENYFDHCTFGTDTYDGSANAANYVMEFNGANQTARQFFADCVFFGSGSSGAAFILATTVNCLSSMQRFQRCLFYNNDHGTMNAMTQAFNIAAGCGGDFIMDNDTVVYGATALETVDSGRLFWTNAAAAATSGRLLNPTG